MRRDTGAGRGRVRASRTELRVTLGTRPRRLLLAGTLGSGLLVALLVGLAAPADRLTVAVVSEPVHTTMSVFLPVLGILLVQGSRRVGAPALIAAGLLAVGVALVGAALCVVTVAAWSTASDRWDDVGVVAPASVVVQIVTMLCGTGLGLLFRTTARAVVADVALPLGLWVITGAIGPLHVVQRWATPYGVARDLLSGTTSVVDWARAGVVILLWGVTLNAAGLLRARSSRGRHRSRG